MNSFNILAISGGGARVVYMAKLLSLMARHCDVRITDFDMVATNSAGTALGMGLSVPDPDNPGKPRHDTQDGLAIANDIAPRILSPRFHRLAYGKAPCSSRQMSRILRDTIFGDTHLDAAITHQMFSVYRDNVPMLMTNFSNNALFNGRDYGMSYAGDMPMHRAASAAMALRPFFNAVRSNDGALLSDAGVDIPLPVMEARQAGLSMMHGGQPDDSCKAASSKMIVCGVTHGYKVGRGPLSPVISSCGPLRREIDMIERESALCTTLDVTIVHEEIGTLRVPADHPLFERCNALRSRISESIIDAGPRNRQAMEDAAEIVFEMHKHRFEKLGQSLRESRSRRAQSAAQITARP